MQVSGQQRLSLARHQINALLQRCNQRLKCITLRLHVFIKWVSFRRLKKPFDQRFSLEPTKENYLNTYGVILRKNNRMEQAVRSYELVIKLQPDFADVYYNCGNALNELDRKQEAVKFKKCLEINPKSCLCTSQLR